MGKHDISELHQLQALSLNEKIERTKVRIRQWVEYWGLDHVYCSFSGGKDSSVLLDICRSMYPDMKAVFLDTSLEFPELRQFVSTFDNVEYLKPPMNFRQVIEKYGYPVISKEVSECAMGARIYLTKLLEERESLTDRQTDRQTEIPYHYFYNKLVGQGKYQKKANTPSDIIGAEHEKAIRGGTDTSITTNATDYSELYQSSQLPLTRGGYDNKYRKLCGLGLYSKNIGAETQERWFSSETSSDDGMSDKRSEDKGDYP